MKRWSSWTAILLALGLLVVACTQPSEPADEENPTVAITAPLDGAELVAGVVNLMGTAADNVAVTRVELQVDGSAIGQTVPNDDGDWSLLWNAEVAGDFEITATAFDAADNSASASVSVTVAVSTVEDTEDPTIAITAPADGAELALGPVTVSGTAADDVGVAWVEVLVDGSSVGLTLPDAAGDWSLIWNADADGTFVITASAFDASGKSGHSEAVGVSVAAVASSGSVSGTITRVAVPDGGDALPDGPEAVEVAAIVPGEVFVVFAGGRPEVRLGGDAVVDGFTFRQGGGFAFDGMEFQQLRAYPLRTGLAFYRSEGLSEQETRDLVDRLRASPAVAEAFPNWILQAQQVVPDDPNYLLQAWHYEQLNLPLAWAVEDGSSQRITVGVLDSGAFEHPDMAWGVGANFANWNGTDPIDDPTQTPGGSAHGTHVAGTVGAITGNGVGVAGVNWDVEILPIRVLDHTGIGSFAGVLEGVYWAAGYVDEAYGGHINANPARVINLSLGNNVMEPCPAALDAVFQDAYAMAGTIAVVSAGNTASPADVQFPGNCPSVITVGATGPTGMRAYYSSFGGPVDVFAPGGDFDFVHPLAPALPAGVLSLAEVDYALMQGTSMAAPHVTGVISLMLAQEPDLTLEQVRERLHNASLPMSAAQCAVPLIGMEGLNLCGAGQLDALAALLGETVATPRAFAYAIPFDGVAPELGLAQLAGLPATAAYQVEATAEASGDFSFSIAGLPPGSYLMVALELRDVENGIANVDRVGFLEVEVHAGADTDATVVVDPIYLALR